MKGEKTNSVIDNLFFLILPALMIVCCGLGHYLKSCKPVLQMKEKTVTSTIKAQFLIKEKVLKTIPKEKTEEKITKVTQKTEPIDLTEKPVVNQQQEDIQKKTPDVPVVRRVYGLRKIYATGLGSGGSLSDAVIGKLGNTLNAPVDTFTATKQEIKGQIVSTTTVTSVPRFVKMVKPEYSKEMLDNKAEGVIKVKALIDIDGKVKKATILNDLGFGSGEQAMKAALEMLFSPAMRGTEPVAVWIVIPIRFVMIG